MDEIETIVNALNKRVQFYFIFIEGVPTMHTINSNLDDVDENGI